MEIGIDRQEPPAPVTSESDAGAGLADPEVAARYVGMTLDASFAPGDQASKAGSGPANGRATPGGAFGLPEGKTVGIPEGPSLTGAPLQTQPAPPGGRDLGDTAVHGQPAPPKPVAGASPSPYLADRDFGNPKVAQGSGEFVGRSATVPALGPGGEQVDPSQVQVEGRPTRGIGFPFPDQPEQSFANGFGDVIVRAVGLSLLYSIPRVFGETGTRVDTLRPAGDPDEKSNPEGLFSVKSGLRAIGAREGAASDDKVTPDVVLFHGAKALPTRYEQELAATRSLESQWVAEMLILARLRRRHLRDPVDAEFDVVETAKTAPISLRNPYPSWNYPIEFDMRVARYIKSRRRDKRRAKKDDQDERQDQSRDAD